MGQGCADGQANCGMGHPCRALERSALVLPGPPDFSGWQDWDKMSDEPFFSRSHTRSFVDVFVEPSAVEDYRAATGPYPPGTQIAKVQYTDEGGSVILAVTAMAKMEPGYDEDHGDWFYGVYDEPGTTPRETGKIDSCIGCHVQAEDRDYVFGPPGDKQP